MDKNGALRIILVDDEPNVRMVLRQFLNEQSIPVEIAAEAANVPEAVQAIRKHKPDLVFLDIEMPGYSGLQLLEFFESPTPDFRIIFVTAYNEYAIQAFKVSAFDYLLKPVNQTDLTAVLDRFRQNQNENNQEARIKLLKEIYHTSNQITQLAISSASGIEFVQLSQVVNFEADGSYTKIKLVDGSQLVSSKPLGEFEEILKDHAHFFRAHRSFLIHLHHIKKLSSIDGDTLIMKNGAEIPLSRYRKKDLEALIAHIRI